MPLVNRRRSCAEQRKSGAGYRTDTCTAGCLASSENRAGAPSSARACVAQKRVRKSWNQYSNSCQFDYFRKIFVKLLPGRELISRALTRLALTRACAQKGLRSKRRTLKMQFSNWSKMRHFELFFDTVSVKSLNVLHCGIFLLMIHSTACKKRGTL